MAGIGEDGGEFFGMAGIDVTEDGGVGLVVLLKVRNSMDDLGFDSVIGVSRQLL